MKALALLISLSALAAPVSPKGGALKFEATASPGALAIRGNGDSPTGSLDLQEVSGKYEVSGTLKMRVESFTTGIAMRDRHMKEKYLETGKYPEAMLTLTKQSLPKTGTGPFEGELVLHGVKHKVSGQAEIVSANGARTVKANFPVKLTDHGMVIPTFAGISVADSVSVETEFQVSAN